ncbi:hypothetical protein DsansV1_C30g0216081 [Dioscorea sansibarensis]
MVSTSAERLKLLYQNGSYLTFFDVLETGEISCLMKYGKFM